MPKRLCSSCANEYASSKSPTQLERKISVSVRAWIEASSARNLFLSWEWVSLWWTIYGRGDRLHVLVARDGDGLVK